MRQGYSDYSLFTYRVMSASGGTESTTTIGARDYKVHSFPSSGSSTLTIHSQGSDKLIDGRDITGSVSLSSTAPAPANIGDAWINTSNLTCKVYGFTDQTIQPSFMDAVGTGPDSRVSSIAVQPDGKIIIGGSFYKVSGIPVPWLARLTQDGKIDKDFKYNIGSGPQGLVKKVVLQSDGKILVGGSFYYWNGVQAANIVRLNSDGTLDSSFVANVYNGVRARSLNVYDIRVQADGKILVCGWSQYYNNLMRINADGTGDTAFINNLSLSANDTVYSIDIQSDNKIIIGGAFTSWNGVSVGRVVRLNSDGTRDSAFTTNTGSGSTSGAIYKVLVLSNGKILLGGVISIYSSYGVGNIVRLNSNGTHDTAYVNNAVANGVVYDLIEMEDQRVLVVGGFTTWKNGAVANRSIMVNLDGVLDTTFNVGNGANTFVLCAAKGVSGKLFLGGDFTQFNSVATNYFVRVSEYGSVYSNETSPDWYSVPIGQENSIYMNGSAINIRYPIAPLTPAEGISASGGSVADITVNGLNYRTHAFNSSDSFIVSGTGNLGGQIEYLSVAGGGGGSAGGGGAGGLLLSSFNAAVGFYSINVGTGGAQGGYDQRGANGLNSSILGAKLYDQKSLIASHNNGYATNLILDIYYAGETSSSINYNVVYTYALSASTTNFAGYTLSGSVQINGSTVWSASPNTQYSISQNSTITVAYGSHPVSLAKGQQTGFPVYATLSAAGSYGFTASTISDSPMVVTNHAIAVGGGGGGHYWGNDPNGGCVGANGGSGGGGGMNMNFSAPGGTAVSGQGYAGGSADYTGNAKDFGGGGGGGAGGVGSSYAAGSSGGPGITSSITGTSKYYAAGGGPSSQTISNTGHGGAPDQAGSSGVVVLRYRIP